MDEKSGPPQIIRALSTAEWKTACVAAALFEDGLWHALMGIDEFRLSDYPLGAPSEDGAKYACYIGISIYFRFVKDVQMPAFEDIVWHAKSDPEEWVRKFYAKPVWMPERRAHSSGNI